MAFPRVPIILASASPRRIEMMNEHGVSFLVFPADTDETIPAGLDVRQSVMYLALKKALHVENGGGAAYSGSFIVAADTVVYKDKIIGKPVDEQDALKILMTLSGLPHEVYTGVAIIKTGEKKRRLFYERTRVFFKEYSEDDLYDYIKSGEPMDKAGAYAIQGGFGRFIHHIEGDRNNVIGFPWQRFVDELVMLTE